MTDYSGYLKIPDGEEFLVKKSESEILKENNISSANKEIFVEAIKKARYILYEHNQSEKYRTIECGGAGCVVPTPFGNLKLVCKAIMPTESEMNTPFVISRKITYRVSGCLFLPEGQKIKMKKLLKSINVINKIGIFSGENETPIFYGNKQYVEFMFNVNVELEDYDLEYKVAFNIEKTIQKLLLILSFSSASTRKKIKLEEDSNRTMNSILESLPMVYNGYTIIKNDNGQYLSRFECNNELVEYKDIYLNVIVNKPEDYCRIEMWTSVCVNSYEKIEKFQKIIDLMNKEFCEKFRFSMDLRFKGKKTIIKIISQLGLDANKDFLVWDITLYIMILKNLFFID